MSTGKFVCSSLMDLCNNLNVCFMWGEKKFLQTSGIHRSALKAYLQPVLCFKPGAHEWLETLGRSYY